MLIRLPWPFYFVSLSFPMNIFYRLMGLLPCHCFYTVLGRCELLFSPPLMSIWSCTSRGLLDACSDPCLLFFYPFPLTLPSLQVCSVGGISRGGVFLSCTLTTAYSHVPADGRPWLPFWALPGLWSIAQLWSQHSVLL